MADDLYARIAQEMEAGNLDAGLWTRAFAESEGNGDKAKALYIKLRHAALMATQSAASAGPSVKPAAKQPSDIERMRQDLRKKLALTGKISFYGNLSLYADCSDDEIAAAVARLRQQEAAGEKLAPELKYAIDALGTPEAREQYDRRLMAILSQPSAPRSAATPAAEAEAPGERAGSKAALVLGALVAVLLFGALGLHFYAEKNKKDVLGGVVDNQRNAVRHWGENDTTRAQTERMQAEGHLENESKAIDNATQLNNRALDIAESAEARRRQQMEYEENHRAAQDEMRMRMAEEQARQSRQRQLELEQRRATVDSIRQQAEQDRKLLAR